jgi:hypothetical protein
MRRIACSSRSSESITCSQVNVAAVVGDFPISSLDQTQARVSSSERIRPGLQPPIGAVLAGSGTSGRSGGVLCVLFMRSNYSAL